METPALDDFSMFDRQAWQRAYNKTPKGKASRKRYRHDNSKHTTDAVYLARKIVAIDGEGINVTQGLNKGDHLYVELAISGVKPIVRETGLRTGEILAYLWENLSPDDINVIYGGSYDFNCWLADIVEDELRAVYKSNMLSKPVMYGKLGIRWVKGKSFDITDGERTVTINDVISFFQCSFVQACDEYLGGDWIGRDVIIAQKALRGNFSFAEITAITDYNALELDRLVELVTELRSRLNRVGLRPRRWNSPGAIASALFLREQVKKHRNENLPAAVMSAARFAYAGGRFEVIKYGAVKSDAFEADLNSAYPRALVDVPSLAGGRWVHHKKSGNQVYKFALYRVSFVGSDPSIPAPLFVRAPNGTISYPLTATNWVWSPEYEALLTYCEVIPDTAYIVHEVWEYQPATDYKPFGFIAALYLRRQVLKAAKDGAHKGIKLGLNSMYGKLAQQVGYMKATAELPARVPTYHQLEWAGYTTSWCRSQVLLAALKNIDAVIAFETDALFTTELLDIEYGEGLGQWEVTEFKSLTYVQSGHYYATKTNGEEVVKCRGIDKGFISRRSVENRLKLPESERVLEAKLTRFYGAGIALTRGLKKYWRKWLTEPKRMQLRPTGKRLHGNCWCEGATNLELGYWHLTYCPVIGGESNEYPVAWINPNPDMREIEELRSSENEYTE